MSSWKNSLLPGDWLTLLAGGVLVAWLFATLWHAGPAGKVRIRAGDAVFAIHSLDQERVIEVPGPLGVSRIVIHDHRVRFAASPCRNQYCVHQGWLARAGQVAVCLPNRVSIELSGEKGYDSLNY
ncbi:MAG: NusG domain II-containing protein [Methylophilaceae bacterium]|nr:NusG domain II-containing protein [Methylophilaceae bacterium]